MRLTDYDYSSPGAYFVTACAYRRQLAFAVSDVADIINWAWNQIPAHFLNVTADTFVVMPNHVHGIVFIDDPVNPVGGQHAGHLRGSAALGVIIRSFKAATTREVRLRNLWASRPLWQPNYYDRIVRNEAELNRIREYIAYNPIAWAHDHENPERVFDEEHLRRWAWLENDSTWPRALDVEPSP